MQILGIDISKYQKPKYFDMQNLKNTNRTFVIMRAGYGKYAYQKDKYFDEHYKNAISAGLYVGAYHFSYAMSVSEARLEADCFLQWIKGKKLLYPVAYDVECQAQKLLGKDNLSEIAYTFMNRVESDGYYTMLYTNVNFIKNYINIAYLKHFDLWLARYINDNQLPTIARLQQFYGGQVGIWQYTSSLKLPTVYKSRIDGDIAYKDYAKIIKRSGLNNVH